mgnify:CR=1 FL=1|tara:strand:- start:784 stop:1182 length:399 start_codon:yes stop_codon:yes gene_type:complete
MTEKETITILNNKYNLNLTLAKDRYSSYDAESDGLIVEVKNRRKYYREKIIEAAKLFVNFQKAQLKDKYFIYVVSDEKGMWIYNISKHIRTITESPAKGIMQPAKTDFDSHKGKILKYSYFLDEKMAIYLEV